MYGKVQDDTAVGDRVQGGNNGDAGVQVKGRCVSVHLGDDLVAAVGSRLDYFWQLVGKYAHRQTVLFPVEGVERLVSREYGGKRTLNAVDIGAFDDSGYVKIIYGGVGIELLLQIHPALKGRQRIDLNLCLTFFDLLLGSLLYQQTLYHSRSLARENNGCGDFVYIALGSHHSALDGISAEGKEIVVDTDVFNGQHLFKSVAKRLLHIGLRSGVIALEGSCLGSFKRSPVQLAVSVYRQLVKLDKKRGYHVRRQLFGNSLPDIISVDGLILNKVGDKVNLSVLVFEILDHRVVNALGVLDYGLYLARLYALTVDFHHPVLAVQINDVAVVRAANDIAGF